MNEKIKPLRVLTTVRAGVLAEQAQQVAEKAMFALLDALQKPTDWAYNAICQAPARKP